MKPYTIGPILLYTTSHFPMKPAKRGPRIPTVDGMAASVAPRSKNEKKNVFLYQSITYRVSICSSDHRWMWFKKWAYNPPLRFWGKIMCQLLVSLRATLSVGVSSGKWILWVSQPLGCSKSSILKFSKMNVVKNSFKVLWSIIRDFHNYNKTNLKWHKRKKKHGENKNQIKWNSIT